MKKEGKEMHTKVFFNVAHYSFLYFLEKKDSGSFLLAGLSLIKSLVSLSHSLSVYLWMHLVEVKV